MITRRLHTPITKDLAYCILTILFYFSPLSTIYSQSNDNRTLERIDAILKIYPRIFEITDSLMLNANGRSGDSLLKTITDKNRLKQFFKRREQYDIESPDSLYVIYSASDLVNSNLAGLSIFILVKLSTLESKIAGFEVNTGIKEFEGTAIMSDRKALFIDQYSYSEPYRLEGLNTWKKMYLGKKIKIRGRLIQQLNNTSVIKEWNILSYK